MDEVLDKLRAIAPEVLAGTPVVAAYLFGSRARGNARPESDADVALLVPTATPTERFELQLRMGGELAAALGSIEVDVVILDDAPLRLAHAILGDSIAFYTASVDLRAFHETRIFREAVDFSVLTERLDREILRLTAAGLR